GVASANSILLVTFAREQQLKGHSAFEAALSAGRTRIRPVLMTAAAMIVGMIPMAIGGAGEEQNAALARADIMGVLLPTNTIMLSFIHSPPNIADILVSTLVWPTTMTSKPR